MMNTKILNFSIIMISSIFLISSLALAGGKGKGKSKTHPTGLEQGEKTGWKGEEKPPGWEQGEKKGWHEKDRPPGLTEEKTEKEKIKARTKKKDG